MPAERRPDHLGIRVGLVHQSREVHATAIMIPHNGGCQYRRPRQLAGRSDLGLQVQPASSASTQAIFLSIWVQGELSDLAANNGVSSAPNAMRMTTLLATSAGWRRLHRRRRRVAHRPRTAGALGCVVKAPSAPGPATGGTLASALAGGDCIADVRRQDGFRWGKAGPPTGSGEPRAAGPGLGCWGRTRRRAVDHRPGLHHLRDLPTNQRCHAAIGAPGGAYVVRSPASDIGTSW